MAPSFSNTFAPVVYFGSILCVLKLAVQGAAEKYDSSNKREIDPWGRNLYLDSAKLLRTRSGYAEDHTSPEQRAVQRKQLGSFRFAILGYD